MLSHETITFYNSHSDALHIQWKMSKGTRRARRERGRANLARRNMVLGMSPGSSYHPHPQHGNFDSPDVEQRTTKCINAWINYVQ